MCKGAFRVEMSRLPTNDRFMQCCYYPTEIGIYQVYVHVLWSGEHVLGSPFRIDIVDMIEELCSRFAEQLEITVRQNNLDDGYSTTSSRSSRANNTGSGSTLCGLIFIGDY